VNFEPNKLALLISLICAGASTSALGKAEASAEREGPSQKAAGWVGDLASPESWPLILGDDLTADASNMGLALSAPTRHVFQLTWPDADVRPAELAELNDGETGAKKLEVAGGLESADPLELANRLSPVDSNAALTPQSVPSAPTTSSSLLLAESHSPVDHTALPVLQDEQEMEPAVAPSSERVMRSLADIRLPVLEVGDAIERIAVVPSPQEPTATPTPSAKVLATLTEVLTAQAASVSPAVDSTQLDNEGDSIEAAIASRQELKRLKQRARAEAAAAAHAAQAAQATESAKSTRPNPFGSDRVAVVESALDRVRGGFVTPGLNISFGIERAVYINGALVTTTSLNISDLGRVTSSVDSKNLTPGSLALIQSGAGNSVAGGAFSSVAGAVAGAGLNANAMGTVVQNTLDGQKIQNVTVVNAAANSLGVLRDLSLQNTLRNALIDSLRR
jgi:hypothetical protein